MKFLKLLKAHFLITWSDKRGAVVTHGSVLPDSAQKTDFYSIVDNATVTSIIAADISASAGIQDSQLNTISTAGKVNTSALTGQIANANLAQLTTPALVSGAALTLLPNIPSGAGVIPLANIGSLLGTPVSKNVTTTYQAATDGFVLAGGNTAGGSLLTLQGYTDSNSSPSTQYIAELCQGTQAFVFGFMPVKKNNYYQITGSVTTYWFIPIGS